MFYRPLIRLGVLQKLPVEWHVAEEIKDLPWGSESVDAPQPDSPRSVDGPWPQRPVLRPDFPAPVLKVDATDSKDHVVMNVTRYLGQIILHSPLAAIQARLRSRLKPVSEDEFESILTKTAFAQFLLPAVSGLS